MIQNKVFKNYFNKRKKLPTVSDIGTGSGYLTSSLIKFGFKDVKGVDILKSKLIMENLFLRN